MKKGGQRKAYGLQDMSKGEYLEYIKKKGSYERLPFNEAVCLLLMLRCRKSCALDAPCVSDIILLPN